MKETGHLWELAGLVKAAYRDFTLRNWQPEDRQAGATLIGNVLAEYGLGWEPEATDRDAIAVEECYHAVRGEFWVVERSGQVVGTGGYFPVQYGIQAVELRKMYLHPSARGQGLGRWLLAQLEAAIAARGFREIWLETATVLQEAIQLYERNGYQAPPAAASTPCTARCDRVYVKYL